MGPTAFNDSLLRPTVFPSISQFDLVVGTIPKPQREHGQRSIAEFNNTWGTVGKFIKYSTL